LLALRASRKISVANVPRHFGHKQPSKSFAIAAVASSDKVTSVHQQPSSFAPQPNVSPHEAQTDGSRVFGESGLINLKLQFVSFFVPCSGLFFFVGG
jgi:hypothetical protein